MGPTHPNPVSFLKKEYSTCIALEESTSGTRSCSTFCIGAVCSSAFGVTRHDHNVDFGGSCCTPRCTPDVFQLWLASRPSRNEGSAAQCHGNTEILTRHTPHAIVIERPRRQVAAMQRIQVRVAVGQHSVPRRYRSGQTFYHTSTVWDRT